MSQQQPESVTYQRPLALIDWLSFTFKPEDPQAGLDRVDQFLRQHFFIDRRMWKTSGGGWQGYATRTDLGPFGLLAYGGESQRGSVYVSLNAHGCGRVFDWLPVQQWGESLEGGEIKRVDLAHDDMDGATVNIEVVKQWFLDGGFTGQGRPPKARYIDDFGSNEGKTFYVGKRQNGKFFRGYEKGKQLGCATSPWFRVEVELLGKDRVIPWQVLSDPARYLAGTYPCLANLSIEQSRIRTQQRACQLNYETMERWVRHSAGKAINVMATVNRGDADRVLRRLVRPGAPKRLEGFDRHDFDGVEVQS